MQAWDGAPMASNGYCTTALCSAQLLIFKTNVLIKIKYTYTFQI